MDTTLIVICAALLIWIGLGAPAPTSDDARSPMVDAELPRGRPHERSS